MNKKIKLMLIDGDGVAILSRQKFSENLKQDFGIGTDVTDDFFKHDFNDCLTGQKDMQDCLPKYLKKWGLKHSFSAILDYWFKSENSPNKRLLDYLQMLRKQGIVCCLATNQEKYRTCYVKESMKFEHYFDHIYSSCDMGVKKPDPRFFEVILKDYPNISKNQVMFWDDQLKNIEVAQQFGIASYLYLDFDSFVRFNK